MALEDVGQVMVIEEVSFSAPWSARAYRYEITENEHSTMLVLRLALWHAGRLARWLRPNRAGGGPVLGYGGFWLLAEDAHISTLAVHPRWRGLGLGELLLLSLLEQGAALAAYRATLEVRVSNQVAQGLYHKVGFEIVSRRKRYYADNNEDAYIMATPPFETPAFQAAVRQCRVQLYARLRAQGVPEGEALTNAGQRTLDKKPQIR
jgi:ribosomal-protein-alanine N-acetyltransferase